MDSLARAQFLEKLAASFSCEGVRRDGVQSPKAFFSCKVEGIDGLKSPICEVQLKKIDGIDGLKSPICSLQLKEFLNEANSSGIKLVESSEIKSTDNPDEETDQKGQKSPKSAQKEGIFSVFLKQLVTEEKEMGEFEEKEEFGEDQEAVESVRPSCSSEINNGEELAEKKKQALYALRRNPKRSQRFIDQEYTLETATSAPAVRKKISPVVADAARACSECGKEFASMKALFGHMRCHPEREWRGIQRPENINPAEKGQHSGKSRRKKPRRSSSSAAAFDFESEFKTFCRESDDDSDSRSIEARIGASYMNGSTGSSNSSLKEGKITGKRSKRSRHSKIELPSAGTPREIKEERDMANCLVLLSCAAGILHDLEDEEVTKTSNFEQNDLGEEVNGKLKDLIEEEDDEATADELEDVQQRRAAGWKIFGGLSLGNAQIGPEIEDSSLCGEINEELGLGFGCLDESARMKYECTTCKRVFKTHQALGGHRASHKKVKGCYARMSDLGQVQINPEEEEIGEEEIFLRSEEQLPLDLLESTSTQIQNRILQHQHSSNLNFVIGKEEPGEDLLTIGVGLSRKSKGHECSICHRVFSSGQALGGHKRCHWGTDRSEGSSSGKQIRILENPKEELIDLNLPAPAEDEEIGPKTYIQAFSSVNCCSGSLGPLSRIKTNEDLKLEPRLQLFGKDEQGSNFFSGGPD